MAFEEHKSTLVNVDVFHFPDFDYTFILKTNPSLKVYDATLSQKMMEVVIAYVWKNINSKQYIGPLLKSSVIIL